jgi:hypothetical protein
MTFENDGSLASIVLKNIKRVAAADYSKQLSKKVFLGQCHVVAHWATGAVDPPDTGCVACSSGRMKAQGRAPVRQRKNLKSERTVLVPGPASERKVVRRIFSSFVNEQKSRSQIAVELNADGNQYNLPSLNGTRTNFRGEDRGARTACDQAAESLLAAKKRADAGELTVLKTY